MTTLDTHPTTTTQAGSWAKVLSHPYVRRVVAQQLEARTDSVRAQPCHDGDLVSFLVDLVEKLRKG